MPDKDPSATLDYCFDWKAATNDATGDPNLSDWLEAAETISSYTISASTVVGSGSVISIVDDYLTDDNTSVTAWVSGGVEHEEYLITCRIQTSSSPVSRTDERSIKLRIINQ